MNDLFEIRQTPEMGRGVFAKKDIEANTNIMRIDRKKFLMYGIVAEHEFFGKLTELREVNKKVHFAFYLTFVNKYGKYEKYYTPKTIRYIKNLPKEYNSLICWNEDELELLDDKNLIERVHEKKKEIYEDFLKVKEFLQQTSDDIHICQYNADDDENEEDEEEEFSTEKSEDSVETEPEEEVKRLDCEEYKKLSLTIGFEEFVDFYTAVETRYIYQQSDHDSKPQLGALVPVLEMFNHYPEGQVIKDAYFLTTIKPIKKDEQIFISYGDRDNETLLFNYGFIIDDHFHLIKNDYLLTSSYCENVEENEKMSTYSEFRVNLAKKYNKLSKKKDEKSIKIIENNKN